MALLGFWGFEGHDSNEYLSANENQQLGYYPIEHVSYGGKAQDLYEKNGVMCMTANEAASRYHQAKIGGNAKTLIIGMARYWNSDPTEYLSGRNCWSFFDEDKNGVHCHINIHHEDGKSYLRLRDSANTLLATSSALNISHGSGEYQYYEFKITIGDTDGAVVIKVNGIEVLNESSIDIFNVVCSEGIGVIEMGGGGTSGVDDMYVLDTTGAAPLNDFLGPVRVDYFKPNADGNHTDWTANTGNRYQAIDDDGPAGPDGDTTYVYSSTVNDKITSAIEDASISETIFALSHNFVPRFEGYTAAEITQLFRISGVDYEGDDFSLYNSYQWARQYFTLNPATSLPWTDSDIDGLEIGMKLKSLTT